MMIDLIIWTKLIEDKSIKFPIKLDGIRPNGGAIRKAEKSSVASSL